MAVANEAGAIAILLGNGDGTFQSPLLTNSPQPFFVVAADFNGDGKLDLAISLLNHTNVAILLGNGDGTFRPARLYSISQAAAMLHWDYSHGSALAVTALFSDQSVGTDEARRNLESLKGEIETMLDTL